MIRKAIVSLTAVLGATATIEAGAHHSGAMFDDTKELVYTGTVTEYKWAGPHVFVFVDVQEKNGKVIPHTFEGRAPNVMRRDGWSRTSLKPGDKVKIAANPVRDGRPVAMLMDVTFPDGRKLEQQWTTLSPTRSLNGGPVLGIRDPSTLPPRPAAVPKPGS